MLSFQEFAQNVRRASVAIRPAINGVAEGTAEAVVVMAKGYIGQELPGWAPLKLRTIQEKFAEGFGGQISSTDPLLRTGRMRDTIQSTVMPLSNGVAIVIGSDDPIARDQELGTARIPPRPFMARAMLVIEPIVTETLVEEFHNILSLKR